MKKKLINIAKSYDFSTEAEFYDYLIDSHINGNLTQCKELFAEMKREDQKEFFNYQRDNCYLNSVYNFYFNLL